MNIFKLLSIVIFLSVFGCEDSVSSENNIYEKWGEVVTVDSTGQENPTGNYTIENVLEFFDSKYKYTSMIVAVVDSTSPVIDSFNYFQEGIYFLNSDSSLSLFSNDGKYNSKMKTIKNDSLLWVGATEECQLAENDISYSCITFNPNTGGYVNSFLWYNLKYKTTANYVKRL